MSNVLRPTSRTQWRTLSELTIMQPLRSCPKAVLWAYHNSIIMHELFLTAHISEDDGPRALQILQGYCAMSPTPILRRRLYWNGPLVHNRGLDLASLMPQGQRARFWNSLNEQLIRQAYTILLLYDITQDQFPKSNTPIDEKP